MQANTHLATLDKTGIICSSACAIHCLLLPAIVYVSPVIGKYLENEWIHIFLLIVLIPVAVISFMKSYQLHQSKKPFILGTLGVSLLILVMIFEVLDIEILYLDKIISVIGSMMLIAGHIFNMYYLKKTTLRHRNHDYCGC